MKRFKLARLIVIVGTPVFLVGMFLLMLSFVPYPKAFIGGVLFLIFGILLTVGGLALLIFGSVLFSGRGELRARLKLYNTYTVSPITDFKKILDDVRANFAADKDPKKNRVPRIDFGTHRQLGNHKIIEGGYIHYAYIVQANSSLFYNTNTSSSALPAAVVFSPDAYFEHNPMALKQIALDLFANKGSNVLYNDFAAFSNVRVPHSYAKGLEVYVTTLTVFRAHLPLMMLSGFLFPIVTNPRVGKSTFIIDCKYWTNNLIANFIHNFPYNND